MEDEGAPSGRTLVLVTGAGRSGTSTMAGALSRLGLHVPMPVLEANESNPKGFYESRWPTRFHKRLLSAAGVDQSDGRPSAAAAVEAAITPAMHQELATWLTKRFGDSARLVVKDPRSAWTPRLWHEVATGLGASMGFLTMLRHPAEIVRSRTTYYRKNRPAMDPWSFGVMSLGGWINANLVTERHTRGLPRVWVSYTDLLSQWRPTLARVGTELAIELDTTRAAEVDEFIDGSLRRHQPSWNGLEVPEPLQEVAEQVWQAGCLLTAANGRDRDAEALYDEASAQYAGIYRVATAIANDEITARQRAAQAAAAAAAAAAPALPAPAVGVPGQRRRWLRAR